MNRRRFFLGASLVLAAPAIVRADNLMRVRGVIVPTGSRWNIYDERWEKCELTAEHIREADRWMRERNVPGDIWLYPRFAA